MRYSVQPKDRIYVKGYVFFSFAKDMGKNVSNKYGQKVLDSAKKSTADLIKTVSKRAIQKTAKETGDLIGNKIAHKTTSISKRSPEELHPENEDEIEIPKEIYVYISLQKTGSKLLMN